MMMHWLLVPVLGALLVSPALAEPPEPQHDGIELSIWVRNLGSDQRPMRDRAYEAILALGPAAKTALPKIIEIVNKTRCSVNHEPLVDIVLRIDPRQAQPHVRELLRETSGSSDISSSFLKSHADALEPHLATIMTSGAAVERLAAMRTLLELGDVVAKRAADDWVKAAANAPTGPVRQAALQAIGRLDSTRYGDVVPALIEAIKDGTYSTYRAVELLKPYADRAIPLLVKELEATNIGRTAIASALLRFGDAAAVHVIHNLTNDNDMIRVTCVAALENEPQYARAAEPLLLLGLDDDMHAGRLLCAQRLLDLSRKHEAAVLPTLIDLAGSPDTVARNEAVVMLGDLKTDAHAAIPALRKCLDDRDRMIRLRAAKALMRIDPTSGPAIAPAVVRSFKEGNWGRRDNGLHLATTLASEIGPDALGAVPYLLRLLEAGNPSSKLPFAVAATRISAAVLDRTLPLLTEYVTDRYDSNSQQADALLELARIGPAAKPALRAITTVMSDESSTNRYAAAEAVLRIAPENREPALAVLRAGLNRKDHRDEALAALKRLGPLATDTILTLQALLKSSDKTEREPIEDALRHITAAK